MLSRVTCTLSIFLMKFRWLLMAISFVAIAYFFTCHLQFIVAKLDSFGIFAPLGFLLLYCLTSIFCLPTVLLVLAGGALFGPVLGVLLNLLGATLGAACGFCISRYLRPNKHTFIRSIRIQQLIVQVERKGWKSVALLRLTPAIPYNLVNYSLGLTRIKFKPYLIATMIFLIPSKIVITYCGYYGINIFDCARVDHFVREVLKPMN